MAIFGPKPWVNPLGRMSIFRLFGLLVFIAEKKKLEKWRVLDQNDGLTLLEQCQFYVFLIFLFLYPRKLFFRTKIS